MDFVPQTILPTIPMANISVKQTRHEEVMVSIATKSVNII